MRNIKIKRIGIKNTVLILMLFISIIGLIGVAGAIPQGKQLHENYVPVCAKEIGTAKSAIRCFSQVVADTTGKPKPMVVPSNIAYGPADFLSAYNLSGTTNSNQIIAIVDAYNNPNIISDLNTYNSQFNLPQIENCPVSTGTTQSPCFQIVDQRGGTSYPVNNKGWGLEIALDVEIAHAICQNCNILLVEADDNSLNNLMTAIDRAVTMGAGTISNSYGGNEFLGETSYDSHLNLPGKAILFSTGDSGWGSGPQYPAASPYVTSVGGTSLFTNPRVETVWSGAGSGCSAYESKPSFQKDTGCSRRTIADVSADADPNTGAWVYDSFNGGLFIVGGTSLAAPLVAGVYAQAGGFSGPGNAVPYNNIIYGTNIYDVTSGANGNCGTYLCTGVSGYDGPSGLGTPIGSGAFADTQPSNSVTVTSPNGGENWQINSTQTIKWSYSGNAGSTVEIDLLKGGSLVNILASNVAIGSGGSGAYSWQINSTLVAGNDYQIKIVTDLGLNDSSNSNFTISSPQSAGINVLSPSGGDIWQTNTKQSIKWNYTGNAGSSVKIDLLKAGTLVNVITSSTSIGSSGLGSYRWRVSSLPYGNDYQIKLTTNLGYTGTSNYFSISGRR